jgi:hypothetical protein
VTAPPQVQQPYHGAYAGGAAPGAPPPLPQQFANYGAPPAAPNPFTYHQQQQQYGGYPGQQQPLQPPYPYPGPGQQPPR